MKIKRLIVSILLLSISSWSFAASAKRPNVIYILADDLGLGDLGSYGQQKLKTPNIDRLALEGMRFTDHYSGNTVCSPSRAVLMTGQHPGRVHCRGNGDENSFALDPDMVTLPRMFKNAGYATGAFGKWGLGHTTREGNENPLRHGFDHYSGWVSQRLAHTYYPPTIVRDGAEEPLEEGTFVHDYIMQDAFDFIRKSVESEDPFFCYIPTAVPHAAMHAPQALHEKWRKVYPEFDDVIGRYTIAKGEYVRPVKNPIAGFAAMIENLDNQVGVLLDMLVELGVDENTIIMFASDNGAHLEGGHDPEFWNSNGPLKGHKRDLYEGGIRTPFLARWPGKIEEGSTSEHISAFWDILPTMAQLIGEKVPDQNDGRSLVPTLLGEKKQKKHKYLYFEFIHAGADPYSTRALRLGKWKAVQRSEKKKGEVFFPVELYNINEDIGEENDVAAQNPEVVERVKRLMKAAHVPLD